MRIQMLQAVIAKRGNMVHSLSKIVPILDSLMDGIEQLEYSMERGIRVVLQDAQVKAKEETQIAKTQDMDHKLANSTIYRQLKKTNKWLLANENNMRVTEQKINQVAVDLNKKIEAKRNAHQRFQDDLKKANAEIAENEDERLKEFKKFNEDVKKFHEHLKKKQQESHCKIDLSKQITNAVTGCQRSSTTYRTNYYRSCSWFLFFCYRRSYSSYRTYSTHSWTDQTCYNNAKAEMQRKADLYWTGEKEKCKSLLRVFEKEIEAFNMKMQKRQEIFEKRTAYIDQKNKEIEKAKEQYQKFMDEKIKDIQMQKETLLEKRSELLIQQHNQVKGEELGQIYKSELEDNLMEFKSFTDTLLLTRMSLKEVDEALKRISENLGSFKVGLKVFEGMIKNQMKDFEAIKMQVDNCVGQGFKGEKCFEITNTFLAQDYLKNIQTETLQAGIGSVVLGRMYNALYSYLTNLKKYPVGLYDPAMGVQENIKKFQQFVRSMNAESDRIGKIDRLKGQLEFINYQRIDKGLGEVSVPSDIHF
jgi:chromosome segregation ATPase